jgi:hypothetical protein
MSNISFFSKLFLVISIAAEVLLHLALLRFDLISAQTAVWGLVMQVLYLNLVLDYSNITIQSPLFLSACGESSYPPCFFLPNTIFIQIPSPYLNRPNTAISLAQSAQSCTRRSGTLRPPATTTTPLITTFASVPPKPASARAPSQPSSSVSGPCQFCSCSLGCRLLMHTTWDPFAEPPAAPADSFVHPSFSCAHPPRRRPLPTSPICHLQQCSAAPRLERLHRSPAQQGIQPHG